jgi:transposase InsO family protein
MAPRGQQTTLQQRVAILEQATARRTDPEIAASLGLAVATVRKWRRIGQRQGRTGLASTMGRPATGALGTLPVPLREAIRRMRQGHPGWGPATILAELQRDPAWADQPLPSRARVAAFLREAKLTRCYQKQRPLPQPAPSDPALPHDEWQLDAQGVTTVTGIGSVCLINIGDVVSRLKIESGPIVTRIQPATDDYVLMLRRAFTNYGLPRSISFDHGSVFFDNTTASPFPTRLHLWLIALGIDVIFTRKRQPTDHALIERTHQTMTWQALLGQTWSDQAVLWSGLDQRREVLNTILPTRALGQPPLAAYPTASHSGRSYRPEWEAELLDLRRVGAYLAGGEWFRQTNPHGQWSLGSYWYNLGRQFARREVAITFDQQTWEWICRPPGTEQPFRFAVKGLTKEALMGDLAQVLALPAYQLALPFTREAWRQLELVRCMADTTL